MTLHASEDVETVWYYGDNSDCSEPFTPQRVHEFNAYYMANADRPYHLDREPGKPEPPPPRVIRDDFLI